MFKIPFLFFCFVPFSFTEERVMLRLALSYLGCSAVHAACCWYGALTEGIPFDMSIVEFLTGWWPILAKTLEELHSML